MPPGFPARMSAYVSSWSTCSGLKTSCTAPIARRSRLVAMKTITADSDGFMRLSLFMNPPGM